MTSQQAFSPLFLQPQKSSLELKTFLCQVYLPVHFPLIHSLLGSTAGEMQMDDKSARGNNSSRRCWDRFGFAFRLEKKPESS